MSELPVFRQRRSSLAAIAVWMAVLAGAAAAWACITRDLGQDPTYWVVATLLMAGIAAFGLSVANAACSRIVIEQRRLRLHQLFREKTVLWDDVIAVNVPLGIYTDAPVVLRLAARSQGLWQRLLCGGRIHIPGGWQQHARLLREIVSHVPHARIGQRLRAYLAAPDRVPWLHRVVVLLVLALAIGVTAPALIGALRDGTIGPLPWVTIAATALPCCLAGSLGREWRPKTALLAIHAVLAASFGVSFSYTLIYCRVAPSLLLLAGCLGWALPTFVLCMPLRPRAWQVICGYAIALLGAIGPTWWYGVREPVPVRHTPSFHTVLRRWRPAVWSPDGSRFGLLATNQKHDTIHYAVVDGQTLETQRFSLDPKWPPGRFCFPDARHLLRSAWFPIWLTDGSLATNHDLWLRDIATQKCRLQYKANALRLSPQGGASPDGKSVVYLARPKGGNGWELHLLQLDTCSATPLELDFHLARVDSVHWTPNGKLLLVEQEPPEEGPGSLTLWSLTPGEHTPERFYHVTAHNVSMDLSPDRRWALTSTGRSFLELGNHELLDLVSHESKELQFPGRLSLGADGWSPDGKAFAYVSSKLGEHTVLLLDPESRKVKSVYTTHRDIDWLALSWGGRLIALGLGADGAHLEDSGAVKIHVIDVTTGRSTTLRRPILDLSMPPTWSPADFILAVPYYHKHLADDTGQVSISVFDFRGW